MTIFAPLDVTAFAAAYPDAPTTLMHGLADHPLLTLEAIAGLAARLPPDRIEHAPGALPIGIAAEDVPRPALSVAETIRTIDANGSWMVLKSIERDATYRALLDMALAPLLPIARRTTGPMAHREAFLFLSSPGSITPFHMDPEHNILLQIRGTKAITLFPAADPDLVPASQSEAFHAGGHRNLPWRDSFAARGTVIALVPGEAVLVPVKAPHFVRNGDAVSISLSITWRSARSVAEGELHSLNALLRARRQRLVRIGERPERQWAARLAYRALRRLPVPRTSPPQ